MAEPFFYLITEHNRTAELAATEPPWGRPLRGVPAAGRFQMSDWHDVAHAVVHRLAGHVARTTDASAATCCVVASPKAGGRDYARAVDRSSGCGDDGVKARLLALGQR